MSTDAHNFGKALNNSTSFPLSLNHCRKARFHSDKLRSCTHLHQGLTSRSLHAAEINHEAISSKKGACVHACVYEKARDKVLPGFSQQEQKQIWMSGNELWLITHLGGGLVGHCGRGSSTLSFQLRMCECVCVCLLATVSPERVASCRLPCPASCCQATSKDEMKLSDYEGNKVTLNAYCDIVILTSWSGYSRRGLSWQGSEVNIQTYGTQLDL